MVTKVRSIRIDDETWEELEKVAQKLKIDKTTIVKMAIIEKIQRMRIDLMEDVEVENS